MPTDPTRQGERAILQAGARYVIGMDEVGRGAIAGPVCVGAAVVSASTGDFPPGLRDSKLLSAARREHLAPQCREWAHAWALGWATAAEVDLLGIVVALGLAGVRALAALPSDGAQATSDAGPTSEESDHADCTQQGLFARWGSQHRFCDPRRVDLSCSVQLACAEISSRVTASRWLRDAVVLLDGNLNWLSPMLEGPAASIPVHTQVRADADCAVVAAASVLAKCARDALMVEAAAVHPAYGWESNKGYGSKAHLAALAGHGPCLEHRLSWLKPPQQRLGVASPRELLGAFNA